MPLIFSYKSEKSSCAGLPNPSLLSSDPRGRFLFAIHEIDDGAVSAFQVDPATGGLRFLNRVAAHGSAPCHCCVDASGSYPLRRMSLSLFCLAAELI